MLRTALLSLILLISLPSSSTSILRKAIPRRQVEPQYCYAIEGFDCKCSNYRVTCTNDHELSSPIRIVDNEKHKYQSVELAITAPHDIDVNDRTFEPVKELYKLDADNLEFRLKFEKFTALGLSSPGIFNRVFPDNLLRDVQKHLALEIYNPDVPPSDDKNLFQNLNANSLELYTLYPSHGTFQQLFDGANIKYLRLSGGDIRSDVSQTFTGNIARLELAKQANSLSVENFPVYPAHEYIINAFYITNFNAEHPSNYANLGELRVFSKERIPADAFRQFPNIHTLSLATEADIDPQALNGLNDLEKLTIKDTKPNLNLLNNMPNLKEFEISIEKLNDKTQCKLIEKVANGQVVVIPIPSDRECTCFSAYLNFTLGETPCNVEHCDHSSCAAIKNNYDTSANTFKAPIRIRRSDGTNAFRPHKPRVYTAPFQITTQDQEKFKNGMPQNVQLPTEDEHQNLWWTDSPEQQEEHEQHDDDDSIPVHDDDSTLVHDDDSTPVHTIEDNQSQETVMKLNQIQHLAGIIQKLADVIKRLTKNEQLDD